MGKTSLHMVGIGCVPPQQGPDSDYDTAESASDDDNATESTDGLDSIVLPAFRTGEPRSLELTRLCLTHYLELKDFFDEDCQRQARVCDLTFVDLLLRPQPTYFTVLTERITLADSEDVVLDLLVMYQHSFTYSDGSTSAACLLPPLPRGKLINEGLKATPISDAISVAILRIARSLLCATPSLEVKHWSSHMLKLGGLGTADNKSFEVNIQPESEDFWYDRSDMCELSRTSAQRNRRMRADRFAADQNSTIVSLEEPGVLSACVAFVTGQWWDEAAAASPFGPSEKDLGFTLSLLKHYDVLQAMGIPICGLAVIIADRVVAFTVCEIVHGQSLNIHIEKASRELYGSYQYVAREAARKLLPNVAGARINRQNAPHPGIRRVKAALGPVESVHKWSVRLRTDIDVDSRTT